MSNLPLRAALAAILIATASPGLAAPPSPTVPQTPPLGSSSLDAAFGATVGSTLCRTSSAWTLLAPGTTGQTLVYPSATGCPQPTTPTVPQFRLAAFTASGTFTTPSTATASTVYHYRCNGGGGPGGTSSNSGGDAGGGGAGAFIEGSFTGVVASTAITVTIGSGGTPGNTGGNTSLGSPVNVTAGGGGAAPAVTTAANGAGGVGGAVSGSPAIALPGGAGAYGFPPASLLVGGKGADSFFGQGGSPGTAGLTASGSTPPAYGAGGGGTIATGGTPGSGAPGVCLIDYVL